MGIFKTARRYGHRFNEAFYLMTYACAHCGHRERIWNSRDGVTPFGTSCPSCGSIELTHVEWHDDVYQPNHVLNPGQRFWRDGTPDEAVAILKERIQKAGDRYKMPDETIEAMLDAARKGVGEFAAGWPKLDQAPLYTFPKP